MAVESIFQSIFGRQIFNAGLSNGLYQEATSAPEPLYREGGGGVACVFLFSCIIDRTEINRKKIDGRQIVWRKVFP